MDFRAIHLLRGCGQGPFHGVPQQGCKARQFRGCVTFDATPTLLSHLAGLGAEIRKHLHDVGGVADDAAIAFVEVSAISAAVEVVVTALRFSAVGMSLDKLPIFARSMLDVASMILTAFSAPWFAACCGHSAANWLMVLACPPAFSARSPETISLKVSPRSDPTSCWCLTAEMPRRISSRCTVLT